MPNSVFSVRKLPTNAQVTIIKTMGRFYAILAVSVVLLVTGEALSTTPNSNHVEKAKLPSIDTSIWHRSLEAEQIDSTVKRSLRTVTDGEGTNGADAEERGFQASVLDKLSKWATKLKLPKTATNLQYRAWLKAKENPKTIYAKLELAGKTRAQLEADPKFKTYLEFSAIWRNKKGLFAA
ncbi:unnamed protein product [Phytophthora lilii]|uniref:RxLR effector protein n=1 Tax=Phytophthora lilii TaxID=2077276 RepID=A0A9W6TTU5_9STRA|nr:unnamed protein product [Phytophthora lilii]